MSALNKQPLRAKPADSGLFGCSSFTAELCLQPLESAMGRLGTSRASMNERPKYRRGDRKADRRLAASSGQVC
jgi:hypothetical protein